MKPNFGGGGWRFSSTNSHPPHSTELSSPFLSPVRFPNVKTAPDIDRRRSWLPFRTNLGVLVKKKNISFKGSAVTPPRHKYACKQTLHYLQHYVETFKKIITMLILLQHKYVHFKICIKCNIARQYCIQTSFIVQIFTVQNISILTLAISHIRNNLQKYYNSTVIFIMIR
jgi:hypothetical protein